MIVAIHQPQYMPWLGYFYKMDRADAFIHLDTVQFRKSEFQNRNRIKSENGWHWEYRLCRWLPVLSALRSASPVPRSNRSSP